MSSVGTSRRTSRDSNGNLVRKGGGSEKSERSAGGSGTDGRGRSTPGGSAGSSYRHDLQSNPSNLSLQQYSCLPESKKLAQLTRKSREQLPDMNARPFTLDEETNQLSTVGGGALQVRLPDATYVEQPDRNFQRVDQRKRSIVSRLFGSQVLPGEGREEEWVEEDDRGGQVAVLQDMVDGFQSVAAYISLLSQGLLGGLGFTNLIMTYFSSPNLNLTSFLRYYSPMAMVLNRYYYVLVCFALVATINKYARNKMWDWKPYGSRQRVFDAALIFLYAIAFVISVVITPYDDLLSYNSMRIPDYYEMYLTKEFKSKLDVWHALSLTRMFSVFVAWLLASLEFSPISTMIYWKFSTQPRLGTVPMTMQRMPDGTTVPVMPVAHTVNGAEMMGSLDRRSMPPS